MLNLKCLLAKSRMYSSMKSWMLVLMFKCLFVEGSAHSDVGQYEVMAVNIDVKGSLYRRPCTQ